MTCQTWHGLIGWMSIAGAGPFAWARGTARRRTDDGPLYRCHHQSSDAMGFDLTCDANGVVLRLLPGGGYALSVVQTWAGRGRGTCGVVPVAGVRCAGCEFALHVGVRCTKAGAPRVSSRRS